MVSSSVDDDMREVASEFKKAAGGVRRATDVKGAVRRTERSIREQTKPSSASSAKKSPPPRDPEPGGAPADRLVEDAADPPPATPAADPSPNGEPESREDPPTP